MHGMGGSCLSTSESDSNPGPCQNMRHIAHLKSTEGVGTYNSRYWELGWVGGGGEVGGGGGGVRGLFFLVEKNPCRKHLELTLEIEGKFFWFSKASGSHPPPGLSDYGRYKGKKGA